MGTNYFIGVGSQVHVPSNEARESSGISERNGLETSVPRTIGNALNKMPSRALQLSNKERLLLRRQALKVKNRPVLAVGNCTCPFTGFIIPC